MLHKNGILKMENGKEYLYHDILMTMFYFQFQCRDLGKMLQHLICFHVSILTQEGKFHGIANISPLSLMAARSSMNQIISYSSA